MKILIADDSSSFRLLVQATLSKRGYQTITASNGQEALDILLGPQAPPLAILDVNMPELDGIEVCRRLRQTGQKLPTYLILLTANNSKADVVAGLQGGADDYVTKPFDREELLARLQVGVRLIEMQRRLNEQLNDLETTSLRLERHAQLAHLGADIGTVLTTGDDLPCTLQRCAELIMQHLKAECTRLWLINPETQMLELLAGAGAAAELDQATRCVPLDRHKIGRIAQTRQPLMTNQVDSAAFFGEQEWIRRTGLVAFAGYPLIVEDRVLGVLALFARRPLTENIQAALATLANTLAQGIQRKRAEEARRVSEEKYRSLINNIPDVTWTCDSEGRCMFISPNVEKVLGYTAAEIYQNPQHWFDSIHPDEVASVRAALTALFSQNVTFDLNYRASHKDGTWRWLHERAVATYEKDGVRYADGVFSDITQQRKIEEALRESEEHLRRAQKLESLGQLAAGIAHEINTPMQYIGDNTRFLLDSFQELNQVIGKDRELLEACQTSDLLSELVAQAEATLRSADVDYLLLEIPKSLQQSLEGVEHVTKIVQSLKDFAHPGLKKKAADLNKAIESTLTVARNEWKYVADVVTKYDPTLPPVPCVLSELNQVVLNLVINAAHAIAEVVNDGHKDKGTIIISTGHDEQCAEIRISDTGAGIPEKVRARIFDPFFTTKEVGHGTGQGLAISHEVIVKKHKGTIEFESEVGRGTTFIVRLPLQEITAAAAVAGQNGRLQ
ncbi:MAG: response regulator [Acidobacteria bacterium]|nr:response regulator [Acidobacteriota bacterium]